MEVLHIRKWVRSRGARSQAPEDEGSGVRVFFWLPGSGFFSHTFLAKTHRSNRETNDNILQSLKFTICTAAPFALLAVFLACLASSSQASGPDSAGVEFFEKHIRPVFVERCYECHSIKAEKVKGRLLLDSRETLLRGGEGGPIIVPNEPAKSRLIIALKYSDPDLEMPPKHQLSPEQIQAFEEWIKLGAPDPRSEEAIAAAKAPPPYDYDAARTFWSFQPVKEPQIPIVAGDKDWALNPVDRFIAVKYQAMHLKPVALADKRTLIRRATYDLTGLPPTAEEVRAFESDASSDAFEKIVDRLLACSAYGEQWGRHWLDVVRYADTSGCNSDFPIPDAYKYRNWVIDAFNHDEPYNQFLTEQIAGDLLPSKDAAEHAEHIIATGYLANTRRFGSNAAEFYLSIEDAIDNLGKTTLGLSVNCARCHDHKFDPIPTSDYYALYGIFASTKFAFPGTELFPHAKDSVALGTPREAKQLSDFYDKLGELDTRLHTLKLEHETLLAREKAGQAPPSPAADPTTLPTTQPAIRTAAIVAAEQTAAKEELRQLLTSRPNVDKAYAVAEGNPGDAPIQHKGNPLEPGDTVPRGFLTILGGQKLPAGETGSGRLELAQWITDAKNPLTARVMVNRIWQHHFDVGLVKTPNDFGARGTPPTHPELLDYLASQFMKSGWSVKSMHKLIMLSRTYQLASSDDAVDAGIDPANDLHWRQNARRLSAEEIRDSLLVVGDSLDRSPGGPHPFPPESEWKYTQHHAFIADYPSNPRSIYLMQQRIRKQPFLGTFDGADTNASTGVRPLSTTALQALFMMNDPLMQEQAAKLSERIWPDADGDDASRIDYAYRLCFNRAATPDEINAGRQYLRACAEKLAAAGNPPEQQTRQARISYLHVLLSSDEFCFWIGVHLPRFYRRLSQHRASSHPSAGRRCW